MSLDYPASAIPEEDRCPDCNGSGDQWAEVTCCRGSVWTVECACGGQPQWEPVAECPSCGGTGRPTAEQWQRIDAKTAETLRRLRREHAGLIAISGGGYDGGRS